MDKEDIKNIGQKVYKGCGCMSIGIVARIYKDLGVLKRGHTVETDRSGLVANYVGQTATSATPAMRGMCSRKPFNSRPTGWLARQSSAGSN